MVSVASFSEAGGHAVNEDAFVVQRHPSGPDRWLCFLADGQGGSAGGAEAARLACHTAAEAALRQPLGELAGPAAWRVILQEADRAVLADPEAGLTTLLGFCISDGFLAGASSGDSAVFALSAGERVENLTVNQRKNPPVGSGGAKFVPFATRLVGRWSVLAMSDGVWKYVGWERLVQAAAGSRGEECVETLQRAARLPGSGRFPDDFTVVLFEDASD
jgi:serine/threonine protein phosphatase PrpC